jgi:hypothetical protein
VANEVDARTSAMARRFRKLAASTMGQTRTGPYSEGGGNHHRLPRVARTCIIIQNIGLMTGQCLLLFVSREAGLIVLTLSGLLGIPLSLHLRLWDSMFITAFFFVINLTGLFIK